MLHKKNIRNIFTELVLVWTLLFPTVLFSQTLNASSTEAEQYAYFASTSAAAKAEAEQLRLRFFHDIDVNVDTTIHKMLDPYRGIITNKDLDAILRRHEREALTANQSLETAIPYPVAVRTPLPVPSFVFSRNLKQGDTGRDILMLQRVLNSDPQTRLASAGPGSPGQETTFFGTRTMLAVTAFQNKHWKEILAPAGLNIGSGFVGEHTRAKLNTALLSGVLPNLSQ